MKNENIFLSLYLNKGKIVYKPVLECLPKIKYFSGTASMELNLWWGLSFKEHQYRNMHLSLKMNQKYCCTRQQEAQLWNTIEMVRCLIHLQQPGLKIWKVLGHFCHIKMWHLSFGPSGDVGRFWSISPLVVAMCQIVGLCSRLAASVVCHESTKSVEHSS